MREVPELGTQLDELCWKRRSIAAQLGPRYGQTIALSMAANRAAAT